MSSIIYNKYIQYISVFGKGLPRKNDNVVVFPFAFHIAVQQPLKPLWSRLLLYELKPSRASFALCAATDDAASGITFGVSLRLTPIL